MNIVTDMDFRLVRKLGNYLGLAWDESPDEKLPIAIDLDLLSLVSVLFVRCLVNFFIT